MEGLGLVEHREVSDESSTVTSARVAFGLTQSLPGLDGDHALEESLGLLGWVGVGRDSAVIALEYPGQWRLEVDHLGEQ